MIYKDHISTQLLNTDFITYHAVIPAKCSRVLFWLHGYRETSEMILEKSELERCAEDYQTAIFLPDLPDTYYMNHPWKNCFTEDFFVNEFIPYVQQKYDLALTREHTYIAGASMGGFGSVLIGSHHTSLFGKIACISGAFIIDDILIGNPEVIGGPENFSHFQNLFGDFSTLFDSRWRNPEAAAFLALEKETLPLIYLTCGKRDMLFSRNQKLYRRLKNAGADITWREISGTHDWHCFNTALDDLFQWLCYTI